MLRLLVWIIIFVIVVPKIVRVVFTPLPYFVLSNSVFLTYSNHVISKLSCSELLPMSLRLNLFGAVCLYGREVKPSSQLLALSSTLWTQLLPESTLLQHGKISCVYYYFCQSHPLTFYAFYFFTFLPYFVLSNSVFQRKTNTRVARNIRRISF